MLPASHRLRHAGDFIAVLRDGRTAGRRDIVVHLLLADRADLRADLVPDPPADPPAEGADLPARAGLVVGRRVGTSVTRHRVARRLRAQLAVCVPTLPTGARVVVRAKASAAHATSAELGRQLSNALEQLNR